MRKALVSLGIALVLVPVASAATSEVKIKDYFFKPERVEIAKGDKVRWVWKGSDVHDVAIQKPGSSKIAVRSEFMREGKFTHKFGRSGTWKIHCENHPRRMRMKVVVSG
jgi:plastocyanin